MTALADTRTEDFARYEFKYLLDARRRHEIETEVAHFMDYDGHVHADLGNSYFVRSLYFENAAATHYYEKIDGVRHRRKFRIRTYARAPETETPIYFEEKSRYIERTFKHRIAIDREHLPLFYDPLLHVDLMAIYPNVPIIEQFLFDSARRRLTPRVLVDYIRRPYTSAFDMNFRLTFDSDLKAAAAGGIFPSQNAAWRASQAGYTILEVKFFRRIPAWFHRVLQAHEMRRISISKFCKGMEVCGLAEDLS